MTTSTTRQRPITVSWLDAPIVQHYQQLQQVPLPQIGQSGAKIGRHIREEFPPPIGIQINHNNDDDEDDEDTDDDDSEDEDRTPRTELAGEDQTAPPTRQVSFGPSDADIFRAQQQQQEELQALHGTDTNTVEEDALNETMNAINELDQQRHTMMQRLYLIRAAMHANLGETAEQAYRHTGVSNEELQHPNVTNGESEEENVLNETPNMRSGQMRLFLPRGHRAVGRGRGGTIDLDRGRGFGMHQYGYPLQPNRIEHKSDDEEDDEEEENDEEEGNNTNTYAYRLARLAEEYELEKIAHRLLHGPRALLPIERTRAYNERIRNLNAEFDVRQQTAGVPLRYVANAPTQLDIISSDAAGRRKPAPRKSAVSRYPLKRQEQPQPKVHYRVYPGQPYVRTAADMKRIQMGNPFLLKAEALIRQRDAEKKQAQDEAEMRERLIAHNKYQKCIEECKNQVHNDNDNDDSDLSEYEFVNVGDDKDSAQRIDIQKVHRKK